MKLSEFFPGLLEHKRAEGKDPKTIHDYKVKLEAILLPSVGDIELEDLREIDADKIKIEGRNHGEYVPNVELLFLGNYFSILKK